jgi:hypothetical protein
MKSNQSTLNQTDLSTLNATHHSIFPSSLSSLPINIAFGHSENIFEAWVSIFEKAFAKLYGNYNLLDGGFTHTAMAIITGGYPERISLKSELKSYFNKGKKNKN